MSLPVLVELVPDLLLRELLLSCQARHSLAAGRSKGPNTDRTLIHGEQVGGLIVLLVLVNMVGDDARVGRHRERALRAHDETDKVFW